MTGEGEETFASLLTEKDIHNVPNIYFRENGRKIKTEEKFYPDCQLN